MIPFLKKVLERQFIIKICGIKDERSFDAVVEAGATAAGFMAFQGSKRHVDVKTLARIVRDVDYPGFLKVGVFVNPSLDEIKRYLDTGLDIIQLHGEESPEFALKAASLAPVWKAFAPKGRTEVDNMKDYPADMILLDSFSARARGGTGNIANWQLAAYAVAKFPGKLILAGGLTPANVAEALKIVRPAGVDVSSGVEAGGPGCKSRNLIYSFVKAASNPANPH